ncbi:MAG: transglutaminase domain-containing protein [Bacteroidota bacterium]
MQADKISYDAAKEFAPFLRGSNDRATLKNVWRFVRENIRYVRDPEHEEVVKTPGCTLSEGKADCKSMTVLVGSILRALGYDFVYRVAFYDKRTPQQGHIYSVVHLDGEVIVVDPVHDTFDEELHAWKFNDYTPAGSAGLGSIPRRTGLFSNPLTWAVVAAFILLIND